ncbi:GH25 family lysozyme [Leifsonia xyli]|nr:GH25 family lysozyme [Leifsonia xyli]
MVSAVIAAILAVGLGGSLSASATEPDRGAGDPTQDHAGSTLAHDDSMLARDGSSQELRQRPRPIPPLDYVPGDDVSGWQTDVNWSDAASKGARFVYIKATEDDDYVSPQYETQWKGAQDAGLYRGSYHFARPFESSGHVQAEHFMNTIHNWKPTQRILPPMIDLEHRCSDLKKRWAVRKCEKITPKVMVQWIQDFVSTVERRTGGVKPVIYTTLAWWIEYTGNTTKFSSYPLFIANWRWDVSTGPGALPGGWTGTGWTLWQHGDDTTRYTYLKDLLPGDQDFFHGNMQALERFSNLPPLT